MNPAHEIVEGLQLCRLESWRHRASELPAAVASVEAAPNFGQDAAHTLQEVGLGQARQLQNRVEL